MLMFAGIITGNLAERNAFCLDPGLTERSVLSCYIAEGHDVFVSFISCSRPD